VVDFACLPEFIQRTERFGHICFIVPAVDKIKIDGVNLKPSQTGISAFQDRAALSTSTARRRHEPALRGNYQVVQTASRSTPMANNSFGNAR
jgi:hypothetical protein